MSSIPLLSLFSPFGLMLLIGLPILVVHMFALIMLPGMIRPGTNAESVGHAAFRFMVKSLGIIFLSVSGIPTLYSVLVGAPLSGMTYTALLLIFALGGILFLTQDHVLSGIDPASRTIPATIFFFTWKFIGLLLVLFGALTLILRLLLTQDTLSTGWWAMHIVLMAHGGLLSAFTWMPHHLASLPPPVLQKATTKVAPLPAVSAKAPKKGKKVIPTAKLA